MEEGIKRNLTFVLTEIKTSIPDNFHDLKSLTELTKSTLSEKDIEYHIETGDRSHKIVIDQKPDGLADDDATGLVIESLVARVKGNWRIHWD